MCSRDGLDIVCDKCINSDEVPSPDGMTCQGAIPGCDNTSGAAGYDIIDGQYHCSVCDPAAFDDENAFWHEEERACKACSTIDPMCNECSNGPVGMCTSCRGGMMPDANGHECIPRFAHCKECPIEQQPDCLSEMNGQYFCGDCFSGFYWDTDVRFCSRCDIDHCADCSDETTCEECTEHYLPTPSKAKCQMRVEGCAIDTEDQTSDNLDAIWNQDRWVCKTCEMGQWWNGDYEECQECQIDHCLDCTANECLTCEDGYTANGLRCEVPNFPNCKDFNPDGSCQECHLGFSFNADESKCIDCYPISMGCNACSITENDEPEFCTECIQNLEADKICRFPNCHEWNVINDGRVNAYAECQTCSSGFGLWDQESTCVECSHYYGDCPTCNQWDHCNDCMINPNGTAVDCIDCMGDKQILMSDDDSFPPH